MSKQADPVQLALLRAEVPRPPRGKDGNFADEHKPTWNRYQALMRLLRSGKTFEEAKAQYDQPRGVCACGRKAETDNSRRCRECRLNAMRAHRDAKLAAGWKYSHKATGPRKERKAAPLPPTWEKPSTKPAPPPKAERVDVSGHTVTKIAPMFRTGLRDLFGTGMTAAD